MNLINKPSTPGHTFLRLKTKPGDPNHIFGFIGNELIKSLENASEPMKKVINSRILNLKQYIKDLQKSGKSIDFDDLAKDVREKFLIKRGRKPGLLSAKTATQQMKAGAEGSSEIGATFTSNGVTFQVTGYDKNGLKTIKRLNPTQNVHIPNWSYHTKDAMRKGTKYSSIEERMNYDPYYRPTGAGRPRLGESNYDLFIKYLNKGVPEIRQANKEIMKKVKKGMDYKEAVKKYGVHVLKELGLI